MACIHQKHINLMALRGSVYRCNKTLLYGLCTVGLSSQIPSRVKGAAHERYFDRIDFESDDRNRESIRL